MSTLSEFKLLTKADAAAIFGVCTKTIDNYIREGRIPPPVPFASREYWHPADFQAFLDRTFRLSTPSFQEELPSLPHATSGAQSTTSTAPKRGSAGRTERDSSPAVRQQIRQQTKLRKLNAGG